MKANKGRKYISKRNRFIVILLVAVLLITSVCVGVGFFGGGSGENSEATGEHNHDHNHDHDHESTESTGTVRTLKVAVMGVEGDIHYTSAKQFKQQVESLSNGKLKLELYGISQPVMGRELANALAGKGEKYDIVITSVSDFTDVDPRMDISSLPFIFDSYEDAWAFMDGKIQETIARDMVSKNLRILGYYSNGFSCLTTSGAVVTATSDVQGLDLISEKNDISSLAYRAMGAKIMIRDAVGVHQLLQTKQCDGFIGGLKTIHKNYIYQVQENLTVTYHSYDAMAVAVGEHVWSTLSRDYQSILKNAATTSAKSDREAIRGEAETLISEIKSSGVNIYRPSLSAFSKSANSLLRGYSSVYGPLIEQLIQQKDMN